MNSRFLVVGSFLVAYLTLGGVPNHGQNRSQSSPVQPDMEEKRLAVNLVRVINTAEMTYRDKDGGSFAEWSSLSESLGFKQALNDFSRSTPSLKNVNLSAPTEIMAGWRLRLKVSLDKKSYEIVLTSKSDKKCSYALVSDEEGLIREARVIGCSEL